MRDNTPDQDAIITVPAAPDRWDDIEQLFEKTPCWCQYWRVSASDYGRTTKSHLAERLVDRKQGMPSWLEKPSPPGVIAYIGTQAVGWCGFGPRREMERLVRSRTIPTLDDQRVWSLVCFLVLPGYRQRGVAQALLRGAIDIARSFSAPALEAYPIDPTGERVNTPSAYMGTVSMFEKEGFQRVRETYARSAGLTRWLMRLTLL